MAEPEDDLRLYEPLSTDVGYTLRATRRLGARSLVECYIYYSFSRPMLLVSGDESFESIRQ